MTTEYGQSLPNYVPSAAQKEHPPVTNTQRLLLLGALWIGFVCQQVAFGGDETLTSFALWYMLLWVSCLVVFHLLCAQKARANLFALPFGLSALFLCVMMQFQTRGYSDPSLSTLNILIIPGLLMLHVQMIVQPYPVQQESKYAALFVYGFFAQPFLYLGQCFRAIGSLFLVKGKNRMVWLGIVIAIPIVFVVLGLLFSADAVMQSFARAIFDGWNFGAYIPRLVMLAVFACLFYSFLYGTAWADSLPLTSKKTPVAWGSVAPCVVVGALLIVYALFTGVQFVYLFGGHGLPADLTYAEYAREGFGQLIWVAAINLAVFSVCLCRVQQNQTLRGLLIALLMATVVILASSFTRLGLYIQAYGLTFRRVQAFWMLCYISAVIGLCGIRLYRMKLPLLRCCMLLMACWYVALNAIDLNVLYTYTF